MPSACHFSFIENETTNSPTHVACYPDKISTFDNVTTKICSLELTNGTTSALIIPAIQAQLKQNAHLSVPSWFDPTSLFFSTSPTEMDTCMYINRLVQYLHGSRSSFVIALLYILRMQRKYPQLALTKYNIHRLLVTGIMLASKTIDDRVYSNAHYARVGGIATVQEINRLEWAMMKMLNFDMFVYQKEYVSLVVQMSMRKVPELLTGSKECVPLEDR